MLPYAKGTVEKKSVFPKALRSLELALVGRQGDQLGGRREQSGASLLGTVWWHKLLQDPSE